MMASPHEFLFRMYKDGSVDADVTAVASLDQAQAAAAGDDTAEYKVINGRVLNVSYEAEPPAKTFKISFTIIRIEHPASHEQTSLPCTFRLSTVNGLGGHLCRYSQARHTSFYRERMDTPLYPLVPGSYELRGCMATLDTGEVVTDCALSLVLQRDGSVSGAYQCSSLSSPAPTSGAWTRDRVCCTVYIRRPDRSVCAYTFDCKSFVSSLRGVVSVNGSAHFASLEFRAVRVERCAWSPSVHRFFPQSFRATTRLLLLVACARVPAPSLPSAMWMEILSFCRDDWFDEEECGTEMTGQTNKPAANASSTALRYGCSVPIGAILALVIAYFMSL